MSADERKMFLDRFTKANPHLRGAHVADVLSMLHDSDSHLEVTEPFYDGHPDAGQLGSLCAIAVVYIYGTAEPPDEWIEELLARVQKSAS